MYKLNQKEGIDTLHIEHPWEVCNVDDAKGIKAIDDGTARAMLASGEAVACKHCEPKP